MGEGDAVIQAHLALCLLPQSLSLLYCVYQHDQGWGWHCGAICKHKPIICGFQAKTSMGDVNFSFAALGTVDTWNPKGEI